MKSNSLKKITSFIFLCVCTSVFFSQENFSSIGFIQDSGVLETSGIYQDGQRIVIFSGEKNGNIILKTYYGWYYDAYYKIEDYPLNVSPLLLHGGLYTRYWKKSDITNEGEAIYWRPATNSKGLSIIPPLPEKEIFGYLVTNKAVYRIRYWQISDMSGGQNAILIDREEQTQYEVDKYIVIDSLLYTCVNGRGLTIRNYQQITLDKAEELGFIDVRISNDGMYAVMGQPEYQVLETESLTLVINDNNSKRRPPRKPPFEYMELDFYYDEIERVRR